MSNYKTYKPPPLSEIIMKHFFPDEGEFTTIGDMEEQFNYIAKDEGVRKAKWWYRKEVYKSVVPLIKNSFYTGGSMFKNYLKIGFRNILRDKANSAINLIGLSIALTLFVLMLIFVNHETSFEDFNPNAKNIYRLNREVTEVTGAKEIYALTSGPMGKTIQETYPEVTRSIRVLSWFNELLLVYDNKFINTEHVVIADPEIFDMMKYKLLKGNPETALKNPNSIVLSESLAYKFFGFEDPMGKLITNKDDVYSVTGIVEDAPKNTHLVYNAFISWPNMDPEKGETSLAWINNWRPQVLFTFLELKPGVNAASLTPKLQHILETYLPSRADVYKFELQRLDEVYLNSSRILYTGNTRTGNSTNVEIFSFAAFLLLLIAAFNYANISAARAFRRSNEIGVRKTLGASKKNITEQFLSESIIITLISSLFAGITALLLLPILEEFIGKELAINYGLAALFLFGGAFIIGIASGGYPALVLSNFGITNILKGSLSVNKSNSFTRRLMIGLQFVISIFLISSVLIVNKQMNFLSNEDLGFNPKQVIVLPVRGTSIQKKIESFENEISKNSNIINTSAISALPGTDLMSFGVFPEGVPTEDGWVISALHVNDYNLTEVLEIEIAKGRYFSKEFPTDSINGIVINETLADKIGWENPIGKKIRIAGEIENGNVIGVIKDFHLKSLHHPFESLLIYYKSPEKRPQGNLTIKVNSKNASSTLSYLEEEWNKFEEKRPFEYYFLDKHFESLYNSEKQARVLLGIFAGTTIFVACLGLIGLISFSIERRRKEIGIRKALGASSSTIIYTLSKEFIYTIVTAAIISIPISYMIMNNWLEEFAYRINLSVLIFGVALIISFLIVGSVIVIKTFKAAKINPVESLRIE